MWRCVVATMLITFVVCPPVERPKDEKREQKENDETEERLGLEYERYMREVVKLLESDDHFRKQIESVNASEIRSGKIAEQLNFVSRGIRSQLDELKRAELERLKKIFRMKERNKGLNRGGVTKEEMENLIGHIDTSSQEFQVKDLVNLIKKTSEDLEALDAQRKEEFKKYEMRKEYLKKKRMEGLNEEDKHKLEKEMAESEKRHKEHPKLNHPGNEEQLKEVWEEKDGLEKDSFDPKTFFHLHDTNGDGMLDIEELEALFQLELDKMYNSSTTEDDMTERYEEMSRMREHVMNEFDTNKDMMVSLEEFLIATKRDEFKQDEDWQTLDNQTLYTNEEYDEYLKELEKYDEVTGRPPTPPTSPLVPPQDGNLRFQAGRQEVNEPIIQPEYQRQLGKRGEERQEVNEPLEVPEYQTRLGKRGEEPEHEKNSRTVRIYTRRPPTEVPLRTNLRLNPRDTPAPI